MESCVLVIGARPNYMKIAPLWRIIHEKAPEVRQTLIHTGQHYDAKMSDVFFGDLSMPQPDICLNIGSGSHAQQTAKVMIALEPVFTDLSPDVVVVVGDVNSTLAATLVAAKLHIPVAHVEAGLRSFDRTMPEEINRIATDSIADILLTSCRDGSINLENEGVDKSRVHFVGNIMIDSLVHALPYLEKSTILDQFNLKPEEYLCTTLHRPSNVDDPEKLKEILEALDDIAHDIKVLFPVHPRTAAVIKQLNWNPVNTGFFIVDPVGYMDFMRLITNAKAVITDSGGIQEETSFLGIPCLTVRENTERPITVTEGTNRLVKSSHEEIVANAREILDAGKPVVPDMALWDGHTAERVLDVLLGMRRAEGRKQD
ncbi:MAG: UDP-N-acetylglucosamine 2-epimerase (non-hydrolyzing) [Kiritimatiellae bacterium]|nr:UDP-N-acetylglucosamine 2-epimerase (non-hydrolyzing) [Kiritimatiellia bacterium]